MKKKLAVLLCLAMIMTMFAVPVFAADAAVSVVIDNQAVTFTDAQPIIDNGRTLVPLRAIFEKMGATVTWDAATSTVTGVKGDTTVVVVIGSVSPTINGVVKTIDVPAKIVNSRTLAPLSFVCEAFGGTLSWNATTYVASVVSAGGTVVTPPVVTPPVVTPPVVTPPVVTPPVVTPPAPVAATAIAPTAVTISKSKPADTSLAITWGSATKVTKMLAGSPAYGLTYNPVEGTDYTVTNNGDGTGTFVLKKELANQIPIPLDQVPIGAVMAITIQFDNGTAIDCTSTVVD
jgi:hypothetical protein